LKEHYFAGWVINTKYQAFTEEVCDLFWWKIHNRYNLSANQISKGIMMGDLGG
jgi:hypothetical protein